MDDHHFDFGTIYDGHHVLVQTFQAANAAAARTRKKLLGRLYDRVLFSKQIREANFEQLRELVSVGGAVGRKQPRLA